MALKNKADRIVLGERSANHFVDTGNANTLFESTGIDWPVSGDQTLLDYGYRGASYVGNPVSLWELVAG